MNIADAYFITTGLRVDEMDIEQFAKEYADKMIRQDWAETIFESGLSTAQLFRDIGEAIAAGDEAQVGHLLCKLVRDYWTRQAALEAQRAAERDACVYASLDEQLDQQARARDMQREIRRVV